MQQEQTKFELQFIQPFSTFHNGKPVSIPYVIDGLLTQGGFSVLGAKPKMGKSSLSRHEAVSVAKGIPFLCRDTVQGEVILVSLEDPRNHTDNCLNVLGYDPTHDAAIHVVEQLSPEIDRTINALSDALTKMPDVRLVIVDTLAKLTRVSDINDYMPMLTACEKLRKLARRFPHLHIQGISHCKKVVTDDPFDALLGSTALRGEPDTSIALYQESGQRVIVTETRIGRNIPPTILQAKIVESAGADVVKDFDLDVAFDQWKTQQTAKTEKKRKAGYEERIITYLSTCDNYRATQMLVLEEIEGKTERLLDAIKTLASAGVVEITEDPKTLTLNRDSLRMRDFTTRFDGRTN